MIDIKDLSFRYDKAPLFRELSLSVTEGNIYGLLGKNGAGKSTLLKLMVGMLEPQEGTLRVMDRNARDRSPMVLAEIFYLSEDISVPTMTAREYEMVYAPFYPRFRHEDFKRYCEEFELDEEKKLTNYSYGQKKKFLLAFGLATDSGMLILDEPTNGLDIPSKSQFRRLVAEAMSDTRTVIISTHQVRDVENLIDPVIIIEDGHIIFHETMEQVTGKLKVEQVSEEPVVGSVLYSEQSLRGYTVVKRNDGEEPGTIDLETLFQTVISSRKEVRELFSKEGKGGVA